MKAASGLAMSVMMSMASWANSSHFKVHMKRCKTITCWTDYPFVELGDAPGKQAPIRHVNVISYDGDKYAKISFADCGDVLEVKAGYLYRHAGRYSRVKTVNRRKLELFKGHQK